MKTIRPWPETHALTFATFPIVGPADDPRVHVIQPGTPDPCECGEMDRFLVLVARVNGAAVEILYYCLSCDQYVSAQYRFDLKQSEKVE